MLLRLPSISASIERILSNFGAIQTKAAKLVTYYREFRGDAELDWWLSEHVIVLCRYIDNKCLICI